MHQISSFSSTLSLSLSLTSILSLSLPLISILFSLPTSTCLNPTCAQDVSEVDRVKTNLVKHLLICIADRNEPFPRTANEKVKVDFELVELKLIEENDKKNEKGFELTIIYNWKNDFLSWSQNNFPVDSIVIPSYKLWTPGLKLLHGGVMSLSWVRWYTGDIRLHSNGSMSMVATYGLTMNCMKDYRNFPNDRHNCIFALTFARTTVTNVEYNIVNSFILPVSRAKEWTTQQEDNVGNDIFQVMENSPDTLQVWYTLVSMQREGTLYNHLIIIPSFLLSLFILISFWVPAKNNQRLSLTIFLFLCLLTQLRAVQNSLPTTVNDLPIIIKYLLCLIFLLYVTMVTSISTSLLRKARHAVPAFVKTVLSNSLLQRALFITHHSHALNHTLLPDDVSNNKKMSKLLVALDEWVSLKTHESGNSGKNVNSDFKLVALSLERMVFVVVMATITITTIITATLIL